MCLQADGASHAVGAGNGRKAGEKNAPVTAALDERVHGVAIGGDGGNAHFPIGVAQAFGLAHAAGAASRRRAPGRFGIVHPQRDVADTVAVPADVIVDRVVGPQRRGQHEADLPLAQDITGLVARAGLRTAVGRQFHAHRSAVEVRRLAGISHPEFNVIGAVERKKIRLNRRASLRYLRHRFSSKRLENERCPHPFPWRYGGSAAARTRPAAGRLRPVRAGAGTTGLRPPPKPGRP